MATTGNALKIGQWSGDSSSSRGEGGRLNYLGATGLANVVETNRQTLQVDPSF